MKMKSLGWVFICVLTLALLACQTQQKPAEQPAAEKVEKSAETVAPLTPDIPGLGIGGLRVSPGIDSKWEGLFSLGERVQKDIGALEAYFATGMKFAEMDTLLAARHAVVAGANYEMIYGGTTEAFWKKVHSPGATLKIKVVSVYASNVPGPHLKLPLADMKSIKLVAGKKLYNAVAFVSCEIHVISKGMPGDTLHNDTYFMDLGYRHQWCCVWGDEEACDPIGR